MNVRSLFLIVIYAFVVQFQKAVSVLMSEGSPIVLVPDVLPEKRRFRLHKWHVVAIVLALIVCVQAFLYVSLLARYGSLDSSHRSLVSEHAALEADYSSLESGYSGLQATYGYLQDDYGSLQLDYDLLEDSYGVLQASFDSYYSDYADLRSLVNQRSQYIDIMDFVAPGDSSVGDVVFSVTGGWSDPSSWSEYWGDVKLMYDWVVDNIDYRSDGLVPVLPSAASGSVEYAREMWQFANETLDLRKGDCEDMAILLASMILSYNDGDFWVECVWISGSLSAHVAVQLPVQGGTVTILDPAGQYFTHDVLGDIDSKQISTEIQSWLNYWKPSMGSDVRVYRVFSNELDRIFSSTSEYTTWMYNRY